MTLKNGKLEKWDPVLGLWNPGTQRPLLPQDPMDPQDPQDLWTIRPSGTSGPPRPLGN